MKQRELEHLIQDLLDGSLPEEKLKELQHQLRTNSDARDLYRDFVHLQNAVQLHASVPAPIGQSVIPIERVLRRQKRKTFRIAAFAAAAILIISLVTMALFKVQEKPPTLVFETAPGTQFEITHSTPGDDTPSGLTMEKGSRLQLSQGTVELTFGTGVKSIVTAPADMTLHDDNKIHLNQGTAWFHVPEGAEGFQVTTRDLDIIDLGTEFGVIATPDDHDEVHVIKGKVNVTANRVRKESATLTAGESRRIDPIGRLDIIPSETSAFLTTLPNSLPYMHWSFDKVADGGFPAEGNHPDRSLGFATPYQAEASSLQVQGRFAKGLRFSANKAEALLTQWSGISGSRPRTVTCWIKMKPREVDLFGAGGLISWGLRRPNHAGYYTKWKFALDRKGRPVAVGYNGTFHAHTKSIADGSWHHIACVSTTNEKHEPSVQIYLDGKLMKSSWVPGCGTSSTLPNTITDSPRSYPVSFGTGVGSAPSTPGSVIRGAIDEIYIFEGALDAQSIHRLSQENRHQP